MPARFDAVVHENTLVCDEHYRLVLRLTDPPQMEPTLPGQFIQLGCGPVIHGEPDPTPGHGDHTAGDHHADAIVWNPSSGPIQLGQDHQDHHELMQPTAMLRRPFSLAERTDGDDVTFLHIIHRVVGPGTSWLASRNVGDPLDLIGPLGNSFTLDADTTLALLVGGGVGLPPMFYLARYLHEAGCNVVAFIGATTASLLPVTIDPSQSPDPSGLPTACVREFAAMDAASVVTTDDGSLGMKGRITEGLAVTLEDLPEAARRHATIYTCGPNPMMQAAARLAHQFGVRCQVCLEQAMACGMGTCQSCIIKADPRRDGRGHADEPHGVTAQGTPWRYRLACTDGPVFPAEAVLW